MKAPLTTDQRPPTDFKSTTEGWREDLERKLDHAIEETFPASDPVAITITKNGAIDYSRQEATSQGQVGHAAAVPEARDQSKRYPQASRYYEEGTRILRYRVGAAPLVALLTVAAIGYGLAWMIHGQIGSKAREPSRPGGGNNNGR